MSRFYRSEAHTGFNPTEEGRSGSAGGTHLGSKASHGATPVSGGCHGDQDTQKELTELGRVLGFLCLPPLQVLTPFPFPAWWRGWIPQEYPEVLGPCHAFGIQLRGSHTEPVPSH